MANPPQHSAPTWQWVASFFIGILGAVLLVVAAHLLNEFNAVKDAVHGHDVSIKVIEQDVGFIKTGMEKLLEIAR